MSVVRHAGARHVVITDVNPYRLELARKMGATLAVDVREKSIADAQKELGMKEGFDIGLEMSGSPDAFRDMLANMCHGGKIAMLGHPHPRDRHRLEHGRLQHDHDQGNLRPRNVRDLVQDDRHAAIGAGYQPGDHASLFLRDFEKGFAAMKSGESGKSSSPGMRGNQRDSQR